MVLQKKIDNSQKVPDYTKEKLKINKHKLDDLSRTPKFKTYVHNIEMNNFTGL